MRFWRVSRTCLARRSTQPSLLDYSGLNRRGQIESSAPATPLEEPRVLGVTPAVGTGEVFVDERRPHIATQIDVLAARVANLLETLGLAAERQTDGDVALRLSGTTG